METAVKWVLTIALFAPMLYFALSKKKWYLYLACGFVGIFPDYFAIEISSSLPLLTGTRIVLLILFGFWLYQWLKAEKKTLPVPIALLIYGGVFILISVFNLGNSGIVNECKGLFILIFEKILLATMILDLIKDRQELDHCLDTLILSTLALAIIGIVQTIFNYDIASVLQIVNPRSSQGIPNRMGMIRAFGTSNAISFGCHCAFVSLLTYYRLERTGKQRYNLILGILLTVLICTFSRSSWLVLAAAAGVLFLTRPLKMIRRVWVSLVLTILLCLTMTFINPFFKSAIVETGYSSLNTVLKFVNVQLESPATLAENETIPTEEPLETIDPDSIELPEELESPEPPSFGMNKDSAVNSRMVEWTALDYMLQQGRGAFGYGYNAFKRGMMHYFYPSWGRWTRARTLDVGLLKVTMDHGIVGLVAYVAFLSYLFICALRNRGKKGTLTFNKLMLFMLPMFLMLNFAAAYTGCFWTVAGLLLANWKLNKLGLIDDEPEPPCSLRRF